MCVCVCVGVHARAYVRVRVCVRVCVPLIGIASEANMRLFRVKLLMLCSLAVVDAPVITFLLSGITGISADE